MLSGVAEAKSPEYALHVRYTVSAVINSNGK